jgi:hypothetical protein
MQSEDRVDGLGASIADPSVFAEASFKRGVFSSGFNSGIDSFRKASIQMEVVPTP